MEQKKQLLYNILKQFVWYRDMAPWFLVVLEKAWSEKLIDDLLNIIQKWVKSIKNNRIRIKLIERVKELQKKWDLDKAKDSENADNILNEFINNLEN